MLNRSFQTTETSTVCRRTSNLDISCLTDLLIKYLSNTTFVQSHEIVVSRRSGAGDLQGQLKGLGPASAQKNVLYGEAFPDGAAEGGLRSASQRYGSEQSTQRQWREGGKLAPDHLGISAGRRAESLSGLRVGVGQDVGRGDWRPAVEVDSTLSWRTGAGGVLPDWA